MKEKYEVPALTRYGTVASMTMGKTGSDVDGGSGMIGNQSMSDGMGGNNDGSMMSM